MPGEPTPAATDESKLTPELRNTLEMALECLDLAYQRVPVCDCNPYYENDTNYIEHELSCSYLRHTIAQDVMEDIHRILEKDEP